MYMSFTVIYKCSLALYLDPVYNFGPLYDWVWHHLFDLNATLYTWPISQNLHITLEFCTVYMFKILSVASLEFNMRCTYCL